MLRVRSGKESIQGHGQAEVDLSWSHGDEASVPSLQRDTSKAWGVGVVLAISSCDHFAVNILKSKTYVYFLKWSVLRLHKPQTPQNSIYLFSTLSFNHREMGLPLYGDEEQGRLGGSEFHWDVGVWDTCQALRSSDKILIDFQIFSNITSTGKRKFHHWQ